MIMMKKPLNRTIGDNIKYYMKKEKLVQLDLANLSGVSQPYISQIINGNANPSSKILEKIANALGIDVKFLVH